MKITYTEVFSLGFGVPRLKSSQTKGEEAQYFYGNAKISEQEFYDRYKKFKTQGSIEAEVKNIIISNDSGEEISNVSWTDNDTRSQLEAKVQVGNDTFEYKQIKQKRGSLYLSNGTHAKSYMLISLGTSKSEYVDIQPRSDDQLLDQRDEILKPYLDVLFGNSSLSVLDTTGIKPIAE